MNKPYIGIKRVLYGDALISLANGEKAFTAAMLAAMIATVGSASAKLKDIQNLHQDTWGYEESDPTVTEYINQLTGQPYYRDKEQAGTPTVNFTLGQYDLETKADLQGGEVVDGVWHRKDMLKLISKMIVAQTKTGNWIVMPNANIVGKGNFVDKNIGLGVSAVPLETGVDGLSAEMWFSEEDVANASASETKVSEAKADDTEDESNY